MNQNPYAFKDDACKIQLLQLRSEILAELGLSGFPEQTNPTNPNVFYLVYFGRQNYHRTKYFGK